MHFTTFLAPLTLALSTLGTASPVSVSIEARQASPSDHFRLMTSSIPGDTGSGTNKNGLFVFSYHTGAGLGVAAAQAGQGNGYFYLNNTELLWTYDGNQLGPWPVGLLYVPYRDFNEISISIAGGRATPGFSINGTGLQSNVSGNGWLACDWWYQAPQIFAWNGAGERGPLPASCSRINLLTVPVA